MRYCNWPQRRRRWKDTTLSSPLKRTMIKRLAQSTQAWSYLQPNLPITCFFIKVLWLASQSGKIRSQWRQNWWSFCCRYTRKLLWMMPPPKHKTDLEVVFPGGIPSKLFFIEQEPILTLLWTSCGPVNKKNLAVSATTKFRLVGVLLRPENNIMVTSVIAKSLIPAGISTRTLVDMLANHLEQVEKKLQNPEVCSA